MTPETLAQDIQTEPVTMTTDAMQRLFKSGNRVNKWLTANKAEMLKHKGTVTFQVKA